MIFKKQRESIPEQYKYLASKYNLDALNFFERNFLTPESLNEISEQIIEPKEIDSIVEDIAIYGQEEQNKVSIANILGYPEPRRKDLLESLKDFFDQTGDEYLNRSVDMLKYTPDNIIEGLSRTFIIEPIKVSEISDSQYFISGNGLHRFTILRIMYLIERYRSSGSQNSLERLKNKYTIPVISKRLDKTKTYCAYIIKLINSRLSFRSNLDDNYQKTGKINIENKDNSTTYILTDEELIIHTEELLRDFNLNIEFLIRISLKVENNPSFRLFLKTYFKNLLFEIEEFIKFKNQCSDILDVYNYKIKPKLTDYSKVLI